MKVQRRYLIGIAVLMLVGLTLGFQALTPHTRTDTTNIPTGIGIDLPTRTGVDLRGPDPPPSPVTLNTVDYAVSVVKDKVLIPDASSLGPGYRIIGVYIVQEPRYATTSNGIRFRDWALIFYISDRPFVNGTTLNTDLSEHLVVVGEGSSTGFGNSHDYAVELLKPSQLCRTDLKTGNQTCTSVPQSNLGQIIQIRGTYLAVQPEVPGAAFYTGKVNRLVDIWGDLSYEQLLALADSLVP